MKSKLVKKPNENTWALWKRNKLMLASNINHLCPSFLHLNMFNILPGKGMGGERKCKAETSRWIWHGWQSPEVKKSQRLMAKPAPSRLSQWSFIQHFSIWITYCQKVKLTTVVLEPPALPLASSSGWLRLRPASWAVLGVTPVSTTRPYLWSDSLFFFLFFFSPAPSSFPFLPLSLFLHFPFLSHLSLPMLRHYYLISVLPRLKNLLLFC